MLYLIRNRRWKFAIGFYWFLGFAAIAFCIGYNLMPLLPGTDVPIPVVLLFPYLFLPFYLDYRWSRRGLKKSKPKARPRGKFDLTKGRHVKMMFAVWGVINLGIIFYGGATTPRPGSLPPGIMILSATCFFGGFLLIFVILIVTGRAKVKKALNAGSGRPWINEFKTSLIEEQYVGARAKILNERLKQKSDWKLDLTRRKKLLKLGLYIELPNELKQPLDQRILVFMESFKFTGVDIEVTEDMKLLVAAQACLLIVNRSMSDYRHLREIRFWKDRVRGRDDFAGYGWREGVDLSWNSVKREVEIEYHRYRRHRRPYSRDGYNVTLHEFAHVLDFADDGVAQSIPVSEDSEHYHKWKSMLDEEFPRLEKAHENYGESIFRIWAKPEIRDYAMREYSWGRRVEFLTCATEAFFERAYYLRREWPEVYALLKDFYRIDPASWQ